MFEPKLALLELSKHTRVVTEQHPVGNEHLKRDLVNNNNFKKAVTSTDAAIQGKRFLTRRPTDAPISDKCGRLTPPTGRLIWEDYVPRSGRPHTRVGCVGLRVEIKL